jgi:Bacterial extracellular solute-binding protein
MPGSTEDCGTPGQDGGDKHGPNEQGVPKFLMGLLATSAGAIAIGWGSVIASDFQHRQPLMFAVLGLTAAVAAAWYVLLQQRRRRPRSEAGHGAPPETAAQAELLQAPSRGRGGVLSPTRANRDQASPSAPPSPGTVRDPDSSESPVPRGTPFRWLPLVQVVAIMCALVAVTFFLGFWTLGDGFAHGLWWGLPALAGIVVLLTGIATLAWLGRRRPWGGWLPSGGRTIMACAVTCLGLSAGGTLGYLDLAPPCPLPVEIPVLASQDNLVAVQAAVTTFEQAEPTGLHQSCYAVDLTVYAARSDGHAEADLESGWNSSALNADGPRPDIWLPSSTEEVRAVNAGAGAAAPRLTIAGSTGSSPLVVAVPTSLISRDAIYDNQRYGNLGTVYSLLQGHGISLSVPNPEQSVTGLLGITRLYRDLTSPEERQIAASGNFPPDSGTMLCDAAQTAQQGHPQSSGYLVSYAAMTQYNNGQLTEGPCPTLTSPVPPLIPLFPSDAGSLDFPFVSLDWGGNSATARLAQQYETDFYEWLRSPPEQPRLQSYGLMPPQPSVTLPPQPQVQDALRLFTSKAPPARILVAIDDSGPMEPYLEQIATATTEVLGTGTNTSVGAMDSFGIWAYPGTGTSTYKTLVPLAGAANSQRDAVAPSMAALSAHAHSAEFDLIADAAPVLYSQPTKAEQPISSVILLTDGDSYANGQDPDGNTFVSVHDLLRPLGATQPRIKVFVIAFGDPGCAESPPGSPQDTLSALATANGGNCVNVNDLGQQLGDLVSQLSAGR